MTISKESRNDVSLSSLECGRMQDDILQLRDTVKALQEQVQEMQTQTQRQNEHNTSDNEYEQLSLASSFSSSIRYLWSRMFTEQELQSQEEDDTKPDVREENHSKDEAKDISSDIKKNLRNHCDDDSTGRTETCSSLGRMDSVNFSRQKSAILSPVIRKRKSFFNTRSIHLYAIVLLCSCSSNPSKWNQFKCWIMALVSFSVVLSQLFIMSSLLFESSNSTCAAHTDCYSGQFCEGVAQDFFRQPRCSDCNMLHDAFNTYGYSEWEDYCISSPIVQNWEFDEADENIMWFGGDFVPNINPKLNIPQDVEKLFLLCLAREHCRDKVPVGAADMPLSTCPYLRVMRSKVSGDQLFLFFFVLIIFTSSLSHDLEESLIEFSLLNLVQQKAAKDRDIKVDSGDIDIPNMSSSVFIVRLTNGINTYILPCMTAVSGSSIIVTESLSAKNIVLNLLAVLFLTEADNLCAELFLSPFQKEAMETWVEEVVEYDESNQLNQLWHALRSAYWKTRSFAMLLSLMIFGIMIKLEPIKVILFSEKSGCDATDNVLLFFFIGSLPGIIIIINFVWLIYANSDLPMKPRVMESLLDMLRNLLALFFSWGLIDVAIYTMHRYAFYIFPWKQILLAIFVTTASICRLSSLNSSKGTVSSGKEFLFDFVLSAVWIFAFSWLMMGMLGVQDYLRTKLQNKNAI